MDISRRGFLQRLGIGAAGVLVAPTLAETLAIGAKKYFFMSAAPGPAFSTAGCIAFQLEKIRKRLPSIFEQDDVFLSLIETPNKNREAARKFREPFQLIPCPM